MNEEILQKFIDSPTLLEVKVNISKHEVENYLFEVCDTEHSGCNRACPVYGRACEDEEFDPTESNPCPYFKNGRAMLERLQGKVLRELVISGKKTIVSGEKYDAMMKVLKE